eukprot:1032672-Pleurochrysis_carterae.AAC.1
MRLALRTTGAVVLRGQAELEGELRKMEEVEELQRAAAALRRRGASARADDPPAAARFFARLRSSARSVRPPRPDRLHDSMRWLN